MPRKGSKRSDRRWVDPSTGVEWASKFEWRVFTGLVSDGYRVRKCDESDSIAYHSPVRQGRCLECNGSRLVQERIYTPDLFVVEGPGGDQEGSYLVECKGYFPGPKRTLFRSVSQQLKGASLRIIFESNRQLKGTKLTPVQYIHKYCKNVIPGVWNKQTEEVVWHESQNG